MTNEENKEKSEEINIISYIQTITDSWRFILVTTFLVLVLAGGYYKLSPQQYEVKTIIRLGTVNGQPIVNPAEIISKVTNDAYSAVVFEKTDVAEMKYLSAKATIPAGTNLLILSTKSTDLELGKEFLKELSAVIVSEEQTIASRNKKTQSDKINLLEEAIEKSDAKLALLKETISQKTEQLRLLKNQLIAINRLDPRDSELYKQMALLNTNPLLESGQQEITDYRFEQILTEESSNGLKSQLIDLTVNNQEIVDANVLDISNSSRSLRPGIIIIAITAIIMGLFFGSFCVLIANWWRVVGKK